MSLARGAAALAVVMMGWGTGCGDDSDGSNGRGGNGITEWLGAELHVATEGDVAASVIGSDPVFDFDAAETMSLTECARQFRVTDPGDPGTFDDGNGRLTELELTIEVVVNGEEREYEVGFESDDFNDFDLGSSITVIEDPDDDSDPPTGQAWAEFQGEWESGGMQVEFEEKATGGTLVIEELSGGTGGLVIPDDTGNFGAFFSLDFADGTSLTGSFTAPCGENDVEAFDD
jgi:hypothetical protein